MINNLGTPSSELQINFGVLQIDTENYAPGYISHIETIFILDKEIIDREKRKER